MNRWLLLLIILTCIASCTKSDDVAVQVKAQAAIDDKIVNDYLVSQKIPVQHVDTTGVCYFIDTLGSGSNLYSSATQITVGYQGNVLKSNLTLGPIFTQTGNIHPSFTLGSVIKGWQLGIPKVGQGGTITLYIPSRYAYGPYAQANLGLPANAVLVFVINLYNVTND